MLNVAKAVPLYSTLLPATLMPPMAAKPSWSPASRPETVSVRPAWVPSGALKLTSPSSTRGATARLEAAKVTLSARPPKLARPFRLVTVMATLSAVESAPSLAVTVRS
jgi:hypothetical protein